MSGYVDFDHTIDGFSEGDRVTIERSYSGNARMIVQEVTEDEDGREIETVSVILSPMQLRALAALCLIQAEELDRAAAK